MFQLLSMVGSERLMVCICKFCGSSQGRLTLSLPEKINLLRFWQKFHHKMIAFHGFQILQKKLNFLFCF